MPNKLFLQSRGVAALALGLALVATPAYAGFQWVSQDESVSQKAPESAVGSPEVVSPIVSRASRPVEPRAPLQASSTRTAAPVSGSMASEAYSLSSGDSAAKEVGRVDLAKEKISVSAAPVASSDSASAPSLAGASPDLVKGFATDVPLPLAMRQLLPQGFNFSIDPDVSMDTLVSYKGGRPWGETMKNMLAAAGLTAYEQGTVITVKRGVGPRPAAAQAAPKLARSAVVSDVLGGGTLPDTYAAQEGNWSAERGDTLRKVLTKWCSRSGFELKWVAEYDYPVEASVRFTGGFEDAVRGLLAGFEGARPQPVGELHANAHAGQRVLVIQVRGNSSN